MKSLKKQLSISLLLMSAVALTFTACKKSDDPAPSTSGSSGTSGTRFFRATIGSETVNLTENRTTTLGDRGVGGATDYPNTWLVYSASIVNPFQGIRNSGFMQIGNIEVTDGTIKASDAQFNAFFTTGAKGYTTTTDEETYDGVMILWYDNNGDEWISVGGDQTGSTFTIDKVTRTAATANSNAKVMVEASFSCKLYGGASETKAVTNGKLKLMFENMEKLN